MLGGAIPEIVPTTPRFNVGDHVKSNLSELKGYSGVIIDIPEKGTRIYDNSLKYQYSRRWNLADCECTIDNKNSGSVWFLEDDERKYFVRFYEGPFYEGPFHIDLHFENELIEIE